MSEFQAVKIDFQLLGGREMVSEERAVELLNSLSHICDENFSHKICLSNKSIGIPAAHLIATRLKSFSSIAIADVIYNRFYHF